jgi:arsenate reductase (glutaredoxin)
MMKLYGIPNCNTVKKARAWLEQNGIAYEFHDFKKNGIDAALLNGWLSQLPWEKLVNRAGMTWRALSDNEKSGVLDNASAAVLMLSKPSVIKRPLLMSDERIVLLGFDEQKYQSVITDAS